MTTDETQDVFANTAVDTTLLRKNGNKQCKTTFVSIADVDPDKLVSPPTFTEAETKKAMRKLGLLPKDLVKMSKYEIADIPGTDEIRARVAKELETRRLETIKNLIEERNKLIAASTTKTSSTSSPSKSQFGDLKRFDKMKKQQIESLINEQSKRNQIKQHNESIQRRLEEAKVRQQEELLQRKQRETEKMQVQFERSRKAQEEKERAVQTLIEKRQQEEERRVAQMNEMNAKHEDAKRQANEQRKAKLEAIRAAQRAHEEEEFRKAQAAINQTKEKQELVARKKQDYALQLREKQKENKLKMQQRLELRLQREEEERQRQQERLKKVMEDSAATAQQTRMKKEEDMYQRKLRERQRIENYRARMSSLNSGKENLIKEMQMKQERAEQNLHHLASNRRQRYRESLDKMQQRSISAMTLKKQNEESFAKRAAQSLRRNNEAHERIMIMKQQKGKQLAEKAAQVYLKQKLGEEKAHRIQRMREYEMTETAERTNEKIREIDALRRKKKEEQMKMRHDFIKKQNKEMEELERLKAAITENPDVDPVALAKQFNVEVDVK